MSSVAPQVGAWVSGLTATDIPDALLVKARDHLLDTLGAGIVGEGREPTRIVSEVFATPGAVPLVTGGAPLEPSCAARVNAVAIHAAEIDDTEGCDHSGAVVVPALMSAVYGAGRSKVTGDDVLAAMVAGYEVVRRVQSALGGYDVVNGRGWHSTAVCGVFAAAAAASRVLGLDPDQTTSALGLAASSSAGTWAFTADGSMTKQLHVANAAASGYQAAVLAQAGATGPHGVFDDVWGGFFATHGTGDADPELLVAELGQRWEFGHSAVKMYAACRSAHPGIDGVVEPLEDGTVDPGDVTGVRIDVSPFLRPMICPDDPRTVEAARLSLPVSIALLLLGRTLDPDSFTSFSASDVVALRGRITVEETEALASPQTVQVTVITTREVHRFTREKARGNELDPFTSAEIRARFRRLTEPRVGVGAAQAVIDFVDGLSSGGVGQLPVLHPVQLTRPD